MSEEGVQTCIWDSTKHLIATAMEESIKTFNLEEVCSNLVELPDEFIKEPEKSLNNDKKQNKNLYKTPKWLESLESKKSKHVFKEEKDGKIDHENVIKHFKVKEDRVNSALQKITFPVLENQLQKVYQGKFSGTSFLLQVLKCSSWNSNSRNSNVEVSDGFELTDRCVLTKNKEQRMMVSHSQFPLIKVNGWFVRKATLVIDNFEVLTVNKNVIGFPKILNQTLPEVSSEQIIPFEPNQFLSKKFLCKECGEPKPADCGDCRMCLDKVQFGGPGRQRHPCLNRICKAGHQFVMKLDCKPPPIKKVRVKKTVDIQCDQCPAKFNRLTLYSNHKRRVHIKPNKCELCEYRAGSKYELKQHKQYKHEGITPQCLECGKTVSTVSLLKRHMLAVHGDKDYLCEVCDYNTTTKDNLRRHMEHNHSGITYACDQCVRKYASKRSLESHVKTTHVYFELFECELCEFKTKEKGSLKKHVQSIHEGKRYQCDQCEFSIKCKSGLNRHKLSIHQNKFYTCDECNYVSTKRYNVKMHKEVEHEGKRYRCEKCPTETRSQGYLQKHIKDQHSGKQLHYCDKCDFKTNSEKNLKGHSKTHGMKLKCESCSYETFWSNQLKSHIEVKHLGLGHICVICGVRKSRKVYLVQHMKSKHEQAN